MIQQITIVSNQGVQTYELGNDLRGSTITKITISELWFRGEPYEHYCGYDSNGTILFSINCLVPCEVVYCT